MKKFTLTLLVVFAAHLFAFAQSEISIVPQPKSINRLKGEFKFSRKTKLVAADDEGRKSAEFLNDLLLKNYGFKLEYVKDGELPKKDVIVFLPQGSRSSGVGNLMPKTYAAMLVESSQTSPLGEDPPESYGLAITPRGIQIAGSAIGQFYALQTLMQLIPVDFKDEAKLPAVSITDEPRFGYRGMHLDVSRHFFPVEFVKKYIDLMAQYKFNRFHWHLTDDQGWRVEIKKYPKLTEIGGFRKETVKDRNLEPYIGDNTPYGGFYTQEQIRDVVAYAKARHIITIPEIELPGHSSAALAAYPELGCKTDYQYKAQTTWGIFKEVYCPTDKTFQFMEDVLTEVIRLFPDSPYIHIGGDEVLKDHWKESAYVQELKKRENLKDEHEVQSYFVRRIEKFINSKGKKIIGWDEILEGGLAPNATVMSWRGEKGGIEAAKSKHDVIMTPSSNLYFDYGQGDPAYEPLNIGNYLPLETVYSYNPHSKELTEDEKKYVIGAQANVWTEYMKTPEKIEYMVFPRILALSEVVWSPLENKNYADFQKRLQSHFLRLDKQNVNYRIPEPVGLKNVILSNGDTAKIEMKSPFPGGKIFYTTDGTEPTESAKLYEKPFEISLNPNEKAEVKTIVVNSKGRKSVVYAATVVRRASLKAIDLPEKGAGVRLAFYKGEFKSVNDFETVQPTETGVSKSVQLGQFANKTNKLKEPFGAKFEGYIYAPEEAIYEFNLESDDGSRLQIGDETILDSDGVHAKQTKSAIVPLSKGFHKVSLRYFQAGGDQAILNFRWGVKGQGLRRIYGGELFH